ncbi:hypothetical protein GOBAR_DD09382 [Gossypium barbadense]|nr:hypothetical protein GOBAR_DD09382 [Gossypium barbadense]
MSLSLLQGYSSAEDEETAEPDHIHYDDSSDDDDYGGGGGIKNHSAAPKRYDSSVFDFPDSSRKSDLPSAFDAFSQVSGPPEFLNHAVEEPISAGDAAQQQGRRSDRKDFKDKKDRPSVELRSNNVSTRALVLSIVVLVGHQSASSIKSIIYCNASDRDIAWINGNCMCVIGTRLIWRPWFQKYRDPE